MKAITQWVSRPVRIAMVLPVLLFSGCVSHVALRSDYDDYSRVYADASNRQLLLNLARLSQDDPAYFIQLASISSQYQFTTSAGFSPTGTRTDPVAIGSVPMVQHALTFGAAANVGMVQTPIFQFVPITGSNLVDAVLTPITDRVFLIFYDQGYPADLVVRTMVESVQRATVKGTSTNYEVLANDPNDPSYPDFLIFCHNLREAQLSHALSVQLATNNVPIYSSTNTNAKLSDVVSAVQAGMTVTCKTATGDVSVTRPTQSFEWQANGNSPTNPPPQFNALDFQPASVPAKPASMQAFATAFAAGYAKGEYKLKMRTFEAALYTVAKQEEYFRKLAKAQQGQMTAGIKYRVDPAAGPVATVKRRGSHFDVWPLMTMTHCGKEQVPPTPLVATAYNGRNYMVGRADDNNQDRTVFTMLSYLFAQTAISTQNLPVQQLIQVQ